MKKYVFLTSSARNVGGAQLYISRKMEWLESIGWDVDMYFFYKGEIVIDKLKQFKNHCISELALPFELISERKRKNVLHKMDVDGCDKLIIESHLINLSLWGEYIVSIKGGMNLCYLLSETFPAISMPTRLFLEYKLHNNLLFGIAVRSIPTLLGESEKTLNRNLPAVGCSDNNVKDIGYNLPYTKEGKVNIVSLGRLDKPYIQPMVVSIKKFVSTHKELEFNILFVGDAAEPRIKDTILDSINDESNAVAYCTGYINPIPRTLLQGADVAIASAGCVNVTKNEGLLTIVIDGEDYMAIGIAGITTNKSLFRKEEPKQRIEDLLEDVIINKKYRKEDIVCNIKEIDYSKHKEIIDRYNCGNAYNLENWPLTFKQRILKGLVSILGYSNYCKLSSYLNL